jgi:hypothetical protein
MDWLTQQDGPTLWIANIGGRRIWKDRRIWKADAYGRPTYMDGRRYGWPMDGRRYGWPTHMEGRRFRADTMDLMDTWEAQRVYQVADN